MDKKTFKGNKDHILEMDDFKSLKYQIDTQTIKVFTDLIEKIKMKMDDVMAINNLLAELVGIVAGNFENWKKSEFVYMGVQSCVKAAFDDFDSKFEFDFSIVGVSNVCDLILVNLEQIYSFLGMEASVKIKMDTSNDFDTALSLYNQLNEGVEDLRTLRSSIDNLDEESQHQEVLLSQMGEQWKSSVDIEEKIQAALKEVKAESIRRREELEKAEEGSRIRKATRKSLLIEYEKKVKEVKMTEQQIEDLREELRKLGHEFSDEEWDEDDGIGYLTE